MSRPWTPRTRETHAFAWPAGLTAQVCQRRSIFTPAQTTRQNRAAKISSLSMCRVWQTASYVALEQPGVDVVDEPADLDRAGDQRVRLHLADVLRQCGQLVIDDVELLPRGVLSG
jgi:hypothetical protein